MRHLMEKAEAYARHFQLEQAGHRNQADSRYTDLHNAIAAHSQAVCRSSIAAYIEGKQGSAYHPAYTPWEAEAWNTGRQAG